VNVPVQNPVLEQEQTLSPSRLTAILAFAGKTLLLSVILFCSFFLPFYFGLETSRMKDESAKKQIQIRQMDLQISELDRKIEAYSDMILLKQRAFDYGQQ